MNIDMQDRINQKPVVVQVMDIIKEMIITEQLKINEQIPSEMELAKMFGVSRPTIREAIKIYNFLGVLKSYTGKGTFVSDSSNISTEALSWTILLDKKNINEIMELRETIERRCIRIIIDKSLDNNSFKKEIMSKLDESIHKMEDGIKYNYIEIINDADYNFHYSIIEGSGIKLYITIFKTLESFLRSGINKTHIKLQNKKIILLEHKNIYESIKSLDEIKLNTALDNHFNDIFSKQIIDN